MITLTASAKQRFLQQLEQRGEGIGIIVGVKKTGCSGYAYTLEFADKWRAENHLTIFDNLYIWVEEEALELLEGITIDYVDKGLGSTFEFINPKEKARCGCGESFTV